MSPNMGDHTSEGAASTMRAARLHTRNGAFQIDTVPVPSPRPTEVLVQIKACGMVPNLKNVIGWTDFLISIPELPAIFGLDATGIVVGKGELVHDVAIGDRVYVNPLRSCGACQYCLTGSPSMCDYATLNGYFGMGRKAQQTFVDHRYAGYAEYMTAPQSSIVKLADNVSFQQATRWGYLGTAYAALLRGAPKVTDTVLINGASGTLGVAGVLFALALGVRQVLGVGRDTALLERVKALNPERVHVHSTTESDVSVGDWARSLTEGEGADIVIDMLPTGAPPEAFDAALWALGRRGRHVNCGGMFDNLTLYVAKLILYDITLTTSNWFSTAQARDMMALVAAGRVNLDIFDHRIYALEDINTALDGIGNRSGGFSNFLVAPDPDALGAGR